MKTIIAIFISIIFCQNNIFLQESNDWIVAKVETNYVQKGISEEGYDLPLGIVGAKITMLENNIILSNVFKKNSELSNLIEQFGDTIYFEKVVHCKRSKDNELSKLYPGDELTECIQHTTDTCSVSNTFLNQLGVRGSDVEARFSLQNKSSSSKCILFIIKENESMVLYNENDFLLLFLTK